MITIYSLFVSVLIRRIIIHGLSIIIQKSVDMKFIRGKPLITDSVPNITAWRESCLREAEICAKECLETLLWFLTSVTTSFPTTELNLSPYTSKDGSEEWVITHQKLKTHAYQGFTRGFHSQHKN